MTIEKLKISLSKFGYIQIIKEGIVFSLLITGEGLAKSSTVNNIQMQVMEYAVEKYPFIEAMRNDDYFFCMILKS